MAYYHAGPYDPKIDGPKGKLEIRARLEAGYSTVAYFQKLNEAESAARSLSMSADLCDMLKRISTTMTDSPIRQEALALIAKAEGK